MKIVCDACSAKYSIADDKVRGKVFKIRCKKCSNIIVVRGSTGEEQPPAATFDQKETRVFDYSGYDDPNEAAAAAAAASSSDAVWHLVIDQEQVGPMSPDDVRQHFAAGDIDSDSYVWREGFGDWEPLASVEMFADIESSAAPAPAAAAAAVAAAAAPVAEDDGVANMFGGPSVEDSATARSDPADLFSAASGDDDVGAELFGGGGDAESAMGGESMADSLFGSADADDEAGMDDDAEQQLRGQRNENSVLFSLNNLAALASPESKAAAPLSSPSSSSSSSSAPSALGAAAPGMAQAGGGEGSGLIDIRAMAGAYLGPRDSGGADVATASAAEDLPVFSQTSFDQPSAVLLPTGVGQQAQTNKLLYILLAVIGVLVVSAVVLVIVVVKGGSKDSGQTQVAALTDPDPNKPATDPKPGDLKPGADDPKPEGDDPKPEGDDPEPEGDDPKPEVGDKKPTKKPTRNPDKKPTRRPDKKPDKKPATADPKPTGGKCIDEVACLLADNPPACCSKYGGGGAKKPTKKPAAGNSDLPERLSDRGDIKAGISKVRGKVTSCGDKHSGKGQVKVSIKVDGSGSVSSATVKASPNAALGSCVAKAVKGAKFRKTQKGGSFTYPFVFR